MHSQKQRHGEGSRYLPASTLENYGPYSEEICKLLLITDLKKKIFHLVQSTQGHKSLKPHVTVPIHNSAFSLCK